jgi:outer membrane lipoprotein LolB
LFRFFFLACIAAAIAGCSQSGRLEDKQRAQELWAARQQALLDFDSWDVHARAALKLESGVYNIGIRWQRQAETSTILLEAPFGQGVFRIESDAIFEDSSAEALLEKMIGWSLPISGLDYWIRGLPRPDSVYSHRLDEGGRARSIDQDQWSIGYLDYFARQENLQLPRRVKLLSDKVTLKLIIERWQQPISDASPSDLFPTFN